MEKKRLLEEQIVWILRAAEKTIQSLAKAKHAVWRLNFVHDAPNTGNHLRCLTVKDEATRLSLAGEVDSSLSHQRGIAGLKQLEVLNGATRYFRSENEPELRAQAVLTFFKR
ncbi:MAG: hypothetical protein H0W49_02735 [Nitrospirales bacterium]|nr:hypothetical protein [Nitrospirales bacterium]